MKKQLLMGTLTAAMMAGVVAPTFAADGLSASAGVASMYLWRGQDLGQGGAAVSGDLRYTMAGAYGGVWASSGDFTYGSEYDLYAGYALDLGGFVIDLSVVNYNYSDLDRNDDTFGETTDAILALSFAGATFKYYDNVAGSHDMLDPAKQPVLSGTGNEYYTLSYGAAGFTGLVGLYDIEEAAAAVDDADYIHLDLTYAYNENLSFTASKVIDEADDGSSDEDLKVVVAYNLPIK